MEAEAVVQKKAVAQAEVEATPAAEEIGVAKEAKGEVEMPADKTEVAAEEALVRTVAVTPVAVTPVAVAHREVAHQEVEARILPMAVRIPAASPTTKFSNSERRWTRCWSPWKEKPVVAAGA